MTFWCIVRVIDAYTSIYYWKSLREKFKYILFLNVMNIVFVSLLNKYIQLLQSYYFAEAFT